MTKPLRKAATRDLIWEVYRRKRDEKKGICHDCSGETGSAPRPTCDFKENHVTVPK